jgi:hypothetical protein
MNWNSYRPTDTFPLLSPRTSSRTICLDSWILNVVDEQERGAEREHHFVGYMNILLKNKTKWSYFVTVFPKLTLPFSVHVHHEGKFRQKSDAAIIAKYGDWYGDWWGGGYLHVDKTENEVFVKNVRAAVAEGRSFGILGSYSQHANMLWFGSDKTIQRYDPQMGMKAALAENAHQTIVDSAFRSFFGVVLPEFTYHGNSLSEEQCVQATRGSGKERADQLCQDYSLLYVLHRARNIDHVATAEDLVSTGAYIVKEIHYLYRLLAGVANDLD